MSETTTIANDATAPKDASASVIARHKAVLDELPFSDTTDFDDAARGFLGSIDHAAISSAQGRTVWSSNLISFSRKRSHRQPSIQAYGGNRG